MLNLHIQLPETISGNNRSYDPPNTAGSTASGGTVGSSEFMPPPPSPRYVLGQQLKMNQTPRGIYFYDKGNHDRGNGGNGSQNSQDNPTPPTSGRSNASTASASAHGSIRSESRASIYGDTNFDDQGPMPLTFSELAARSTLNSLIVKGDYKAVEAYVATIKDLEEGACVPTSDMADDDNADDFGDSPSKNNDPCIVKAAAKINNAEGLKIFTFLCGFAQPNPPAFDAPSDNNDSNSPKDKSTLLNRAIGSMNASYDVAGFTPLHWCAALGGVDAVSAAIKAGADPNVRSKPENETPLHRASRLSQLAVVTYLLDNGGNATRRNRRGELPIDVVAGMTPSGGSAAIRKAFLSKCKDLCTLVLSHPDCMDHRTTEGHQEAPERIPAIMAALESSDNFAEGDLNFVSSFPRASLHTISKAHHPSYVSFVANYARQFQAKTPRSGRMIEAFTPRVQREVENLPEKKIKVDATCDTNFSKGSLDAALRAAGGVCYAIDEVVSPGGSGRNAFVAVRPPGHHAGFRGHVASSASCGFCIFNSVAVGALHALDTIEGVNRVAIVDFDVHHGNGTEEIVKQINRPDQLFFASVHLFGGDFYPGSGEFDFIEDNCMNLAVAPMWNNKAGQLTEDEFGRSAFRKECAQRLLPAMRAFNPDLILVSAGFDGSKNDIGNKRGGDRKGAVGLDLGKEDYSWIVGACKQVADVCCDGRIVVVLEGGYGKNPVTRVGQKSNPADAGKKKEEEDKDKLNLEDLAANASAAVKALTIATKPGGLAASSKKYAQVHLSSRHSQNIAEKVVTAVGSSGEYGTRGVKARVGSEGADNDGSMAAAASSSNGAVTTTTSSAIVPGAGAAGVVPAAGGEMVVKKSHKKKPPEIGPDGLPIKKSHKKKIPEPIVLQEAEWVQCSLCTKWRKLPESVFASTLPEIWHCELAHWTQGASCLVAEEVEEVVVVKKSHKKKPPGSVSEPQTTPGGTLIPKKKRGRPPKTWDGISPPYGPMEPLYDLNGNLVEMPKRKGPGRPRKVDILAAQAYAAAAYAKAHPNSPIMPTAEKEKEAVAALALASVAGNIEGGSGGGGLGGEGYDEAVEDDIYENGVGVEDHEEEEEEAEAEDGEDRDGMEEDEAPGAKRVKVEGGSGDMN
jgi:acetoin utilization deacetylase AcuC-like enzyme